MTLLIFFLVSVPFVSIYLGFYYFNRFQKIRNIPRSISASAAQGLNEFYGFVWPTKLLYSPLSNALCAGYILNIGKSRDWEHDGIRMENTNFQLYSTPDILLLDNRGFIAVEMSHIELHQATSSSMICSFKEITNELKEKLLDLAKANRQTEKAYDLRLALNSGFPGQVYLREFIFFPGDRFFALGNYTTKKSPKTAEPLPGFWGFLAKAKSSPTLSSSLNKSSNQDLIDLAFEEVRRNSEFKEKSSEILLKKINEYPLYGFLTGSPSKKTIVVLSKSDEEISNYFKIGYPYILRGLLLIPISLVALLIIFILAYFFK